MLQINKSFHDQHIGFPLTARSFNPQLFKITVYYMFGSEWQNYISYIFWFVFEAETVSLLALFFFLTLERNCLLRQ